MNKPITIRVRGKDGTFRFDNINPQTTTVKHIKELVEKETQVPIEQQILSAKPITDVNKIQDKLVNTQTLTQAGVVQNGIMLYLAYDATKIKSKQELDLEKKQKEKEETLGEGDNIESLGLKYRKKNWTLDEYLNLVDKHKINIKHQKFAVCSKAGIDQSAAANFQTCLRMLGFKQQRMGFIIGNVAPGKKVAMEDDEDEKPDENENREEQDYKEIIGSVIYEPPQENGEHSVKEKQDHKENDVDAISSMFGMERVGWIFSHDGQREYPLTAEEIYKAAQFQAKYGPAFATLTVSPNEKGETEFEAFQVSKQCVELVSKGILKPHSTNPEVMIATKPVFVQRKQVTEVDCLLLITNVAITGCKPPIAFRTLFPVENRPEFIPEFVQSLERVKALLQNKQFNFVQKLTDFHLLIFISNFLDIKSDFPVLTEAIRTQNNNLAKNYEAILQSYCNM